MVGGLVFFLPQDHGFSCLYRCWSKPSHPCYYQRHSHHVKDAGVFLFGGRCHAPKYDIPPGLFVGIYICNHLAFVMVIVIAWTFIGRYKEPTKGTRRTSLWKSMVLTDEQKIIVPDLLFFSMIDVKEYLHDCVTPIKQAVGVLRDLLCLSARCSNMMPLGCYCLNS